MKSWKVAVLVAAVAGLGAGYLTATPLRGRDVALSMVTVWGDGRSVAVLGGLHDVLSAEETATTVRLRMHAAFDPLPISNRFPVAVVHLRAPLGDRQLIDATRPDRRPFVRRPSYVPAGFAPGPTLVDFAQDRCEMTFTTPGGAVLTVVEEPVTAATSAVEVTPDVAWRGVRDGHTLTVTAVAFGYDRVEAADAARVGASIGT